MCVRFVQSVCKNPHGNVQWCVCVPAPNRLRVRGLLTSASSSDDEGPGAASAATMPPPSTLLSLPSFKDAGSERGADKEVWVSVFSFLSRPELLACMSVCKAWYKW